MRGPAAQHVVKMVRRLGSLTASRTVEDFVTAELSLGTSCCRGLRTFRNRNRVGSLSMPIPNVCKMMCAMRGQRRRRLN